jgi:flagellar hook-basal body complex protein FliE
MTSPIGDPTTSATSARSLIEAALRRHADAVSRARPGEAKASPEIGPGSTKAASFDDAMSNGLEKVDTSVRDADRLVDDFVGGKVEDFHEVALRLKQSELSFRFAMEVRNKLVDAYREVMRMSV